MNRVSHQLSFDILDVYAVNAFSCVLFGKMGTNIKYGNPAVFQAGYSRVGVYRVNIT